MICRNYEQLHFASADSNSSNAVRPMRQGRTSFLKHSDRELAQFVFWTQVHNAIASQMLQPTLSPYRKGGQEHQFILPHHTTETEAFL